MSYMFDRLTRWPSTITVVDFTFRLFRDEIGPSSSSSSSRTAVSPVDSRDDAGGGGGACGAVALSFGARTNCASTPFSSSPSS